MRFLRFVLLLATVLVSEPALAYRPFDGTDAAVVEHGNFELEAGTLGYLREGKATYLNPSQILNYGALERVELVLELHELMPSLGAGGRPFAVVDDGAFVKAVLVEGALQGKSGPSLALEVGGLLPTFHGEPGAGFSAALIGSVQLPPATFHLNLEGARTRAADADLAADMIIEGPAVFGGARPVAELLYERVLGAETVASALLGFIDPLSESFALDGAARLGSRDERRLLEVRLGFTWAFAP